MEYLFNELLSLINWQATHPFFLNEHLIEDLVELMVSSRNLEEYYATIFFSTLDSKNIMAYGEFNELVVFYNTLNNSLNLPEGQIFNTIEMNLFPLIKLIFIIYHEVEHMHQRQLWYNPNSSIESQIIKASRFEVQPLLDKISELPFAEQEEQIKKLRARANRFERQYNQYYKFVPTERMANIKAFALLQKLLNSHPCIADLQELYNYINKEYFNRTVEAYCSNSFPTKYYLKQQKVNLAWRRLALKIHGLTSDEKTYLGLRLTEKEIINLLHREENFSLKLTP